MPAIDPVRLKRALDRVTADLIAELDPRGVWIGQLASSALSTATAVSALTLAQHFGGSGPVPVRPASVGSVVPGRRRRGPGEPLIEGGLAYLRGQQNPDGGFGDTDRSRSNIATTMLVLAAFRLAGYDESDRGWLGRAETYVAAEGSIAGLRRRYGTDKTFAVPILTNAALAGMVPWDQVDPLPFELAAVPQRFYRFLRLPVVSYAIPALVGIGQARFHFRPPRNPIHRTIRRWAIEPTLGVLRRMQPTSGGYLEAIPLTSFVVMSLAATGRASHPVVDAGVEFLRRTVRPDGSWPIDTNLATWNTTLAIHAIGWRGLPASVRQACLEWVLACQHRRRHPFTGADPGGWGWTDTDGAVPDADDTPCALLALRSALDQQKLVSADERQLLDSAVQGIGWLLSLQNRDGGWPTFCRGWGKLPFDRSGADLTAHALRALHVWGPRLRQCQSTAAQRLATRSSHACERAFRYLARAQRADGTWVPLWFGNQDHPQEENPVYGTAKVLLAYAACGRRKDPAARRGVDALLSLRNMDAGGAASGGSWGSVEETSVALESLMGHCQANCDSVAARAVTRALTWLVERIEENRHRVATPIGFYFAKLWYYEKLYPLTFAAAALDRATGWLDPRLGETDAGGYGPTGFVPPVSGDPP